MFIISITNKQISKPFFFFWKSRYICKFWIQNQFCAILGDWDICKTKPGSEIDQYIFIRTWNGPHSTRVALRWPDWLLTGPVIPWEAHRGPKLPQLLAQRVSGQLRGQSRHLKTTLRLWGSLQVNRNMNLSISKPGFGLQISQPPKIAQNWGCIQNSHMDLSFQKKQTVQNSVYWFLRYWTNKHCNVSFETPCIFMKFLWS